MYPTSLWLLCVQQAAGEWPKVVVVRSFDPPPLLLADSNGGDPLLWHAKKIFLNLAIYVVVDAFDLFQKYGLHALAGMEGKYCRRLLPPPDIVEPRSPSFKAMAAGVICQGDLAGNGAWRHEKVPRKCGRQRLLQQQQLHSRAFVANNARRQIRNEMYHQRTPSLVGAGRYVFSGNERVDVAVVAVVVVAVVVAAAVVSRHTRTHHFPPPLSAAHTHVLSASRASRSPPFTTSSAAACRIINFDTYQRRRRSFTMYEGYPVSAAADSSSYPRYPLGTSLSINGSPLLPYLQNPIYPLRQSPVPDLSLFITAAAGIIVTEEGEFCNVAYSSSKNAFFPGRVSSPRPLSSSSYIAFLVERVRFSARRSSRGGQPWAGRFTRADIAEEEESSFVIVKLGCSKKRLNYSAVTAALGAFKSAILPPRPAGRGGV